jgi:hypothetical protein
MRMMLLAFVVIASLMSPLCDCAYTFQPPQGTPGFECSAPGDCQPGLFTKIKHCCGGPPNGKYCSDCCVDTDCSGILPGSKFICTPLSFLFPSLYETVVSIKAHNHVTGMTSAVQGSAMEALDFPETRSIFPLENVLLKSRKL